jgi:predicted DNA-binding transcriptional regulator YafY
LPPLLFTEDEATAIVLGLLLTHRRELDLPSAAIEGALAKVYRVLPLSGRERLQAVGDHMMFLPYKQDDMLDATTLIGFSEAIHLHRRIFLEYNSYHNEGTQRIVEPYGLVGWKGHWYLVAFCCLRKGFRSFRLDRAKTVRFLEEPFVRDEDFDWEGYVNKHLISVPEKWQIEVEFQAKLYEVQRKVPASYGHLSETPTGVLFQCHHDNLHAMARYLMGLDLPFVIHQPPELRGALLDQAERMRQIATSCAGSCGYPF